MAERANRRAYLGPARRRPEILDAALELFAQGGFAAASMAAIARRAGTSKPVLYDCFPGGKEEIYRTLLEREERRFRRHMLSALQAARRLPLEEALRTGLGALLDYARINPSAFRVIFGAPGTANPEIARRAERVRERILAAMRARARALAAAAGAPPEVAEVYLRCLVALAEGLARWWASEHPMDRDALVALVVAWLIHGFRGLVGEAALREAGLPASGPAQQRAGRRHQTRRR